MQGESETSAMSEKAAARSKYNQAAILDKLLDQLPAIAASVSEPLSKTDKILFIGGRDGIGINRITRDLTDIIAQMPAAVEALTGIDVLGSSQNLSTIPGGDRTEQEAEVVEAGNGSKESEGIES